jgi:hypothetical protein
MPLYIALYPSVQWLFWLLHRKYSQLLSDATDAALRTLHTVMCNDLCHILPCVLQCNGYSDYYAVRIHSCCAMQLTLCLRTHCTLYVYEFCRCILPCILQCNGYSDGYTVRIHSCRAMQLTLYTLHTDMCNDLCLIYCPVSFSANGYSDYYVFTVGARCNWRCVTYTPHSVMCNDLCHYILSCVIQCKWLSWLLRSAYS